LHLDEIAAREIPWPAGFSVKDEQMDVFIMGEIGENFFGDGITSAELVPHIRNAASQGIDRIRFEIDSPGGSVPDAMAIFNAIQDFPGETLVDITGQASSAGGIIAAAGDQVNIRENASFFAHPANVSVFGANAGMLELALEFVTKGTDQIVSLLAKRSGQTQKAVRELVESKNGNGTQMTGAEAVEFGFADELIEVKTKNDADSLWLEAARENAHNRAALVRSQMRLLTA
jgi:ATP-dependent protease ClpP protease subunit